LISALLSQSDYKNPNRFRETWELFYLSIETKKTKQNHLHFGLFLYEHNEYEKAINCLELTFQTFFNDLNLIELSSVLNGLGVLYRKVNKFEQGEIALRDAVRILQDAYKIEKSEEILSAISLVKNSLATLYGIQWKYEQAISEFEEAEKNWRKLNKKEGNYLELLSLTLNNYGIILKDIGKYEEAGKKLTKSLEIRRKLNKETPELFESVIVSSLSNLANLETKLGNDDKSRDYQFEAVNINRKLAETNPNKHLSHLAQSLVSLGNKYVYLGEYSSAEQSYLEAVQISNDLVINLCQSRPLDLAYVSINLAEFYQRNIYKKETSILCAIGAYVGVFSLARVSPEATMILFRAAKVINSWNIDFVELFKVLELSLSEQLIQSVLQISHADNANA